MRTRGDVGPEAVRLEIALDDRAARGAVLERDAEVREKTRAKCWSWLAPADVSTVTATRPLEPLPAMCAQPVREEVDKRMDVAPYR